MHWKRDRYINKSGKRQESLQHGWFLGRFTSSEAKLPIESVAKLAAGAEVASKTRHVSDCVRAPGNCRSPRTPTEDTALGDGLVASLLGCEHLEFIDSVGLQLLLRHKEAGFRSLPVGVADQHLVI
jgi:hypothetical protein